MEWNQYFKMYDRMGLLSSRVVEILSSVDAHHPQKGIAVDYCHISRKRVSPSVFEIETVP
jgi:hypothetical protein